MTLSPSELGYRLLDAFSDGGLEVEPDNELHERPILLPAAGEALRIFLWNATPGGPAGVRADSEYRVQTTRPGDVPFLVSGGPRTLLLGYHEELGVFAAWDVRFHANPGSSSSLQIPLETLEEAASAGFASNRRDLSGGEEEVVVAFSPEGLRTYIEILPSLETAVATSSDASLGEVITSGEEPPEEDLPPEEERRVAVRTVAVLVRDRRFRSRVISAYGGRCAFCGVGLGITDAAHIQPVRDGGPDAVANGVCACPTHHRAFDRGFITIADDLRIELNHELVDSLGYPAAEIEEFEARLNEKLAAPQAQAPNSVFLEHHRARWHEQ